MLPNFRLPALLLSGFVASLVFPASAAENAQ
jgi:hypothetical protein